MLKVVASSTTNGIARSVLYVENEDPPLTQVMQGLGTLRIRAVVHHLNSPLRLQRSSRPGADITSRAYTQNYRRNVPSSDLKNYLFPYKSMMRTKTCLLPFLVTVTQDFIISEKLSFSLRGPWERIYIRTSILRLYSLCENEKFAHFHRKICRFCALLL